MRSSVDRRDEYLGLGFFVHPVPLGAVALMALNDHYLKYQFASWWTGKLSDFCGLFFFPLFLCALFVLAARLLFGMKLWLNRPMLITAIALTDLVFVAIKTSPDRAVVAESVLRALGFPSRIVADPTDLIALSVSVFVLYYAAGVSAVPPTVVEYKSNT